MLLLRAEEPKPVFLFSQLLAQGFPCSSVGKESACNAGDPGSIPGLGRYPGGGQYSHLENSRTEKPWGATVHGVAKSWTGLSD